MRNMSHFCFAATSYNWSPLKTRTRNRLFSFFASAGDIKEEQGRKTYKSIGSTEKKRIKKHYHRASWRSSSPNQNFDKSRTIVSNVQAVDFNRFPKLFAKICQICWGHTSNSTTSFGVPPFSERHLLKVEPFSKFDAGNSWKKDDKTGCRTVVKQLMAEYQLRGDPIEIIDLTKVIDRHMRRQRQM